MTLGKARRGDSGRVAGPGAGGGGRMDGGGSAHTRCDTVTAGTCRHTFVQICGLHETPRGTVMKLRALSDYNTAVQFRGL